MNRKEIKAWIEKYKDQVRSIEIYQSIGTFRIKFRIPGLYFYTNDYFETLPGGGQYFQIWFNQIKSADMVMGNFGRPAICLNCKYKKKIILNTLV